MADTWFLSEEGLRAFLESIECDRTLAGAKIESQSERIDDTSLWLPLEEATDEQLRAGLRSPRPVDSYKAALLPPRELVARYGKGAGADPLAEAAGRAVALVGMRACECRALAYLDRVMLGEPVEEPFYKQRRENCVIVSVDCAEAAESCFCNLLDQPAFPEANFDVNLSPVEGGYVVASGSEKGRALIEANKPRLTPAGADHIGQQERMRERTSEALREQNAEFAPAEDLAESLPDALDGLFWADQLAECVQCGGCTAVCPTCYCFMLYDRQGRPQGYERVRTWDSCQLTGYSVMAGPPGTVKPDPRRQHMSKFQRRFTHKLWHDVLVNETYGCVGCGRCRETCPGAIDMRQIITEVTTAKVKNA